MKLSFFLDCLFQIMNKTLWHCNYCDSNLSSKRNVLVHISKQHKVDGNNPPMFEQVISSCQTTNSLASNESNSEVMPPKKKKSKVKKMTGEKVKPTYDFKRLANVFNLPEYSHVFSSKSSNNILHDVSSAPQCVTDTSNDISFQGDQDALAINSSLDIGFQQLDNVGQSESVPLATVVLDDEQLDVSQTTECSTDVDDISYSLRVRKRSFKTPYKTPRGKCSLWPDCEKCSIEIDCGECINCNDKSKQ